MNSSSNKVDLSKANVEPEVVIEYEPEPDDYNYEPPETEVDEEELRQLSWTGQGTDSKKVMLVVAVIAIAVIIGWAVGMAMGGIAQDNNDEKRKATMAQTVKTHFDEKLKNLDEFSAEFEKLVGGEYDKSVFDATMSKLQRLDYMLDMSSEVSSEVILLNGDPRANPVKALREYSENTMLMTQLLRIHRNETTAHEEDSQALSEKKGANECMYAMRVNADAVYYLGKNAPREQFANGIQGIYTLREAITDDKELSSTYSVYKSDNGWSVRQREMLDYVPEKSEAKSLEGLELPNRIMYDVLDRRGASQLVFADEIVLLDRKLLFGKALNALERYNQRTQQIKSLLDETKDISSTISGDLGKFFDEKKAASSAGTKDAIGLSAKAKAAAEIADKVSEASAQ